MLIFYIIDHDKHQFYFFEEGPGHTKAKEKLAELNSNRDDKHKLVIQYKTLKSYYGTVWLGVKSWNESGVRYVIYGRWKDIKSRKADGYTIKKTVLTSYDKFMKRFEDEEDDEDSLKDIRSLINNTGLP